MTNQDNIKIYTNKNIQDLAQDKPPLEDGQIYIYVLLNSQGNIKIGKTSNMQQRHRSLSGSNGGGNKIVACYCSPATWVISTERACHNHYEWCRIKGTEWFCHDSLKFDDVVRYVDGLFQTSSYKCCNELRKKLIEKS